MEEKVITITIKFEGDRAESIHDLGGINPVAAGVILIEVGKDILAQIAGHHLADHTHPGEEEVNGD